MGALAIRLTPEPVRTLLYSSIDISYSAIGTPFVHPIRILFVQNLTDQAVMFSFDGVNDHFPLPSESFLLLDVTANKTVSQGFYVPEGTVLYVRELVALASGSVYVSVFYGIDT